MDAIRLTFDTKNDVITLETPQSTFEADFPPRDGLYAKETGVSTSVMVSAMMHAMSLYPHAISVKDSWWRLDILPEDLLEYENKKSGWDATFSLTFVGKNPYKKLDGCISQPYLNEGSGDVNGYRGVPLKNEWDDEEEYLWSTDEDTFFLPGDELGIVMKRGLEKGYTAKDYWMVRPSTGPDSGQWKAEFRLPTTWKRPPLPSLDWH
ncbi:hypothetical protein DDD64_08450 [Actinotignum sanguinis]|uniref:hypothetical protein n=1 Tax=Actinotignum sanguinis TaxID=1445614 RepID=UPI000F7F7EDE|nr:hypothetical protein [Actinotignum sanguinis]MDY5148173.1 hypothetical protein [Actinotignum sanguinis]RTE47659.1 hypothetical protein DDD64_08450 [Actinotignum sanguinis]